MGKGHYLGGHTVLGFGATSKARGRRGGINSESPADRQKALNEENRRRKKRQEQKLAEATAIRNNVKLAKKLGDGWHKEKGPEHFDKGTADRRSAESALAFALRDALTSNSDET